jgi:hypothetical protein
METKKLHLYLITLVSFLIIILISGCSDNSTSPPSQPPGFKPTIRLKTNSTFQYTNDTLFPGGSRQRKPVITNDTIKSFANYFGKDAYRIISHSINSQTSEHLINTYYVTYDSAAGIFWQYGITNFINPSQSPTWDVAANFAITRGSSWVIGTVSYTVNLPIVGMIPFSGPLSGKIVDSTYFLSTKAQPDTIRCYKIEYLADISGDVTYLGTTYTLSTQIYVDYYIGYYSSEFPINPSGLVRITLNPFTIHSNPTLLIYDVGGYDRILQSYTIAQ